ncbi:ethanolamine ammonia-lyase subunit EutC [Pedobacter sp. AW31-3R]|uniref:ethanolamine ammonia-lyase subunit EutC n=1 Tax=Pedobacter sp. AW31-3R TaxID=3445781 RepID=UPI003FA0E56C
MAEIVTSAENDPLKFLKDFTSARIAIGHAGTSIPIKESLEFKLAHAHARDAVYSAMDTDTILGQLRQFNLPVLTLQSRAESRAVYLQRPDFGRVLKQESADILEHQVQGADIAIVAADGLSAIAVEHHLAELLSLLLPKLQEAGFSIGPICLVQQGRVAIADDIGDKLKAGLSLIFIGERPGLSAADSMGAYLTYRPRPGLTDDSRNCISNIRSGGLDKDAAVSKIFYLIQESFRRKLSGVMLKDNAGLL